MTQWSQLENQPYFHFYLLRVRTIKISSMSTILSKKKAVTRTRNAKTSMTRRNATPPRTVQTKIQKTNPRISHQLLFRFCSQFIILNKFIKNCKLSVKTSTISSFFLKKNANFVQHFCNLFLLIFPNPSCWNSELLVNIPFDFLIFCQFRLRLECHVHDMLWQGWHLRGFHQQNTMPKRPGVCLGRR